MATMSEKYMGINVVGPDQKPIGTIKGLLTSDDHRQYYVVESNGLLRRNRTTYYIPADQGIATGSQRLSIDVPLEQFDAMGWTTDPAPSLQHPG